MNFYNALNVIIVKLNTMATYVDIESIDIKIPGGLQPQTFTQSFDAATPLVRKDFAFPHISKLNLQGNIRVDLFPNNSIAGGTGVIVIAPETTMDYIQIIETESELYIALRRDVVPSKDGIAARIAVFADDVSKIRITDYGRFFGYLLTPQSDFKLTAQDSAYVEIDGLTSLKSIELNANDNSSIVAKNFSGMNHVCFWARQEGNIKIANLKALDVVLNSDRHSSIVADGEVGELVINAASASSVDAKALKDNREIDSANGNSHIAGSSPNPVAQAYGKSVIENAPQTEVILGVSGEVTVDAETVEQSKVFEIPLYKK